MTIIQYGDNCSKLLYTLNIKKGNEIHTISAPNCNFPSSTELFVPPAWYDPIPNGLVKGKPHDAKRLNKLLFRSRDSNVAQLSTNVCNEYHKKKKR